MPLYEYECRTWGDRFELLVLGSAVPACPSCEGRDLTQQISGFSVSSQAIRNANFEAARRKFKTSKNNVDKEVGTAEEFEEHYGAPLPKRNLPK